MDKKETIKAVECLSRIDVEGYGLGFYELVAAGAVKAYLCGFPRQEALGMLQTIRKGTSLKMPAPHKKPELPQAIIKGPELIRLVDTAVAEQKKLLEEQVRNQMGQKGEIGIRKTAIQVLSGIQGHLIVEDISPEFLCFLADCYRMLRV